MTRNILLTSLIILGLTSCDPVHQLRLNNETSKPIVVIYRPLIDISPIGSKIESFDVNGVAYAKVVLDSGQVMQIGNVVARYNPRPDDVKLDFLEIHIGNDTVKLIGKKSIFSEIQKVDKLDWRLIIKDK